MSDEANRAKAKALIYSALTSSAVLPGVEIDKTIGNGPRSNEITWWVTPSDYVTITVNVGHVRPATQPESHP